MTADQISLVLCLDLSIPRTQPGQKGLSLLPVADPKSFFKGRLQRHLFREAFPQSPN